jgi:pyruvate carboxylase subunit B
VTPVSQFYFQQAFNNVMFGTWERIAEPYGQMVLGYFGKTPVPPDPEVVKIAAEQLELEPTTEKPLARNDADPTKGAEPARQQLREAGLEETDENIFIVATCKDKGLAFLKGEAEIGVRKEEKKTAETAPADGPARYTVTVNGKGYDLAIDGDTATVNGQSYQVSLGAAADGEPAPTAQSGDATPVAAQMPGKVIRLLTQVGDRVEAGDGILVLEAMKMEMPVTAPIAGTVSDISVGAGDQVANEQVLAHIS